MTHRAVVSAMVALLAFGACHGPAAGQESALSRWSASLGVVHHVQHDELASPVRYSGFGAGARIAWLREGVRTRFGVQLDYAASNLSSSITEDGNSTADLHRFTISVPYLRRAAVLHDGRIAAYVGGRLAADGLYRDHFYSAAAGDEIYGDLFVTLAAAAAWEYAPRPDLRLTQRLALPVMGILWRTPYTGLKHAPDAQFATLPSLLGLDHEIALRWALSPAVDVVIAHQVTALRHDDPWRLATLTNRLRAGLAIGNRRASHAHRSAEERTP